MLHKDSSLGWRHAVHNWEVADYAALIALSVAAADKGKMALVASPQGFWVLLNHVGPVWQELTQPPVYYSFHKTGTLTVAPGVARWYPPVNTQILSIEAWVSTPPTGASILASIKKNGASIATVTIAAGAYLAAPQAVNLAVLTTDYLTVDVTQIGSATAGTDLQIRLGVQ